MGRRSKVLWVLLLGACGDDGGASDASGTSGTGVGSTMATGPGTSPSTSASDETSGMAGTTAVADDGSSTGGLPPAEVVEVFTLQGELIELACDASYVYASVSVFEGGPELWRVPVDGSADPEVIDSGAGFSDIAIEGSDVLYLSTGDGGGNEVRVHDGASPSTVVTFGGAAPWTFDFDATDFWVATGSANTSAAFAWFQVPRDGSAVSNFGTEMAAEPMLPFELHLTSSHIVWSRQGNSGIPTSPDLWWVPTTGGDATDFDLPAGQRVVGFDVLGDVMYLLVEVNQDIDLVQTMEVDGMPTTVMEVLGMAGGGLHVDPQHLYFSTYDGAMWRADIDGQNLVMIQDEVLQTTRVEGCDDYVLFDDRGDMGTTVVMAFTKQ